MAHARTLPPHKVRIQNPLSGIGITSRKSAQRYVSRGLAVWVSAQLIHMIEDDHRRLSAVQSIGLDRCVGYDRAVHDDHPTGDVHKQLRHTPVVKPMELLAPVRRKWFKGGRNGPVCHWAPSPEIPCMEDGTALI